MNKIQAEAIAQALLEPNIKAQEEIRSKRAREALHMARKRQVAVYALIGCGIGGVTAQLMDAHFTQGISWGGIAGGAFGWLFMRLRYRSRSIQ